MELKYGFFLFLCFVGLQTEYLFPVEARTGLNDRPIIGILSQEPSYSIDQKYPNRYHSYIVASYVKFIEGGGARVVPIWIGKDDPYYEDILSKINGILFPGGATYFTNPHGYADAGKVIYRIAKRMNENGDYFPIWGTCLGFELLTYLAANGVEHRSKCSSQRQKLPLEFVNGFRDSRMFRDAPQHVIDILSSVDSTINFHKFCVTVNDLKRVDLENEFQVLSLNNDTKGLRFISSLEHRSLPFYGVQFHPEKNIYEWVEGRNITHDTQSVIASQYFATFFVQEARKNRHSFANKSEEQTSLIYNYGVTYTGLEFPSYQQCYLFESYEIPRLKP